MKHITRFADVIVGSVWFISLIAVNLIAGETTLFILAYAIPVVLTTWKHDLQWGFLVAAMGAFAAVASGAISGNANAGVSLAEHGLFSYAQLSAVAVGIFLGKRTHYELHKFINERYHE